MGPRLRAKGYQSMLVSYTMMPGVEAGKANCTSVVHISICQCQSAKSALAKAHYRISPKG